MAEYRRRCEAGVTLEDGRDVALANARTFDRAAGRDQLGGSTYAQARRKSAVGAPGARLPSTKSSMKPETCNHAPAAVSGRSSEPTKLLLPDMSTSVAPTSRIPVRTRMQGRLGRDPRGLVFANTAPTVPNSHLGTRTNGEPSPGALVTATTRSPSRAARGIAFIYSPMPERTRGLPRLRASAYGLVRGPDAGPLKTPMRAQGLIQPVGPAP
jgi:hypothetical protein